MQQLNTLTAICLLALSVGLTFSANAQLDADPGATAVDGVNLILGVGAEVSNITSSGGADQVGTFTCTGCGIGFDGGMIIASGSVDVAEGPNLVGGSTLGGGNFGVSDPDLAQANPFFSLNDAAVVEFDFVAQGDSVVFNYVWASEEYPEFVFSSFNDAFGFFLSGPGINGPYSNNAENIAIIPGTNLPVTIDNVNAGNNDAGCTNCEFYVINTNNTAANGVQFDGYTVPLQAAYGGLTCGETYHIKIAVADAGDTGLDSAVFFEENSFYTPTLDVSLSIGEIGLNDSTIYEGCGISSLIFSRNGDNLPEETLSIEISGTAENGVDYTNVPTEIVFPPGENEVVVPISANLDGEVEGLESIIFTYLGGAECLTVEEQVETIYITESLPLEVELDDVLIDCNESTVLEPVITGGYGIYEIEWFDGTNALTYEASPGSTTTYAYTVSDTCGVIPIDAEVTVEVQTYDPVTVDAGGPLEIDCLTLLESTATADGGNGEYTYLWTDAQGNDLSTDPAVSYDPEAEGSIFVEVTDGCGSTGSDELEYTFTDVNLNVDLPEGLEGICQSFITVEADDVNGGIGAYSYEWFVEGSFADFGESVNVEINGPQTVLLQVTDECGNVGTDETVVDMTPTPISLALPADIDAACLENLNLAPQTLEGGVGAYTYSWSADTGESGQQQSIDLTIQESTTVTLDVSDECGNTATDELDVNLIPNDVSVDLGPNLTVTCLDVNNLEPEISNATAPLTYSWVSDGTALGAANEVLFQTDETTTVEVTVTDACGFTASDQILVDVPPVPVTVSAGDDFIVPCQNNTTVEAAAQGGVGAYVYDWFVNGFENESNSDEASFIANGLMEVEVLVEDACGNTASDIVLVNIPENPPQLVISQDTLICRGESVSLSVEVIDPVGTYDYIWTPLVQQTATVTVAPSETQNYSVTVMDACQQTSNANVTVVVDQVQASFDFAYTDGWGIETFNTSFPQDAQFYWDFGDGETSEEFQPTHEFLTNRTQTITLVAETENGCRDDISGVFHPIMDIFVPNAFTPDGDGVNDVFKAEGHSVRQFEMWVFNRWGEVVFYSNDIDQPWLGEVDGGTHYGQNEVYNWVVKAVGIRNTSFERQGTVVLIR
jgi:gliding motility-associated-like protein